MGSVSGLGLWHTKTTPTNMSGLRSGSYLGLKNPDNDNDSSIRGEISCLMVLQQKVFYLHKSDFSFSVMHFVLPYSVTSSRCFFKCSYSRFLTCTSNRDDSQPYYQFFSVRCPICEHVTNCHHSDGRSKTESWHCRTANVSGRCSVRFPIECNVINGRSVSCCDPSVT